MSISSSKLKTTKKKEEKSALFS